MTKETITAHRSLQNFVAIFFALVLCVVVLKSLASILQPLFIAGFFCYFAIPLRNRLQSWKLPPFLANALGPILVILLMGLLSWIVSFNLQILLQNIPTYNAQIERFTNSLVQASWNLSPNLQKKISEFSIPLDTISHILGIWVGSFLSFLSSSLIVGFYMIFLLLESRTFSKRLMAAYGESKTQHLLNLVQKINGGILAYIRMKAVASLMIALFSTFFIVLFQVDSWSLWGLLTFFGNFVPYLGAAVMVSLPVLVLFLQKGSVLEPTILFAVLALIQNYMGAYIEPRLAGKTLNLSPLIVVVSLAFWYWLWGIVGMILAIPILVAIKITLERIPATKSFAELLGDHGQIQKKSN